MSSAISDWERCRPFIEAAMEHGSGTHSIEDIEAGIYIGDMQFWAGKKSAIITEIVVYPKLKSLNFFLGGGDLKEMVEILEPAIVEFARFIGCERVCGTGRKGWERVLKPRGYKNGCIVMHKDIKQ